MPEIKPLMDVPCQAMFTIHFTIVEPMEKKKWRLVGADVDSFNLELQHRSQIEAMEEVKELIRKVKEEWAKNQRLISVQNLLRNESDSQPQETPNSQTETSASSDAPIAEQS